MPRIALLSTGHKTGKSSLAVMLTYTLGQYFKKPALLVETGTFNDISSYVGLTEEDFDITRSPSQVHYTLGTGEFQGVTFKDYTYKLNDFSRLLVTMDSKTSVITSLESALSVADQKEFEFVITDIPYKRNISQAEARIIKDILAKQDIVVIVASQSDRSLEKLKTLLSPESYVSDYSPMAVINKYDEMVISLRDISKRLGLSMQSVAKVSYNPMIIKYFNESRTNELFDAILNEYPLVYGLRDDLTKLANNILNGCGYYVIKDWEV